MYSGYGGDVMKMENEDLTFEDGILLCKHIYQCAIHKTLQGVMEEWEIFEKTHEMLKSLEEKRSQQVIYTFEKQFDNKRLDEILFKLNMENVYATI